MSTDLSRKAGALLAALIVSMLALGGLALAASGIIHPVLRSPGQASKVHAGKIPLIVKDTGVINGAPEFVTISPKRKTDKHGDLKLCSAVAKGCDFVALKRRPHHPGQWIYTGKFTFPGYWAVTPGKYYWQAEHTDCRASGCRATSKIGSFRVVP